MKQELRKQCLFLLKDLNNSFQKKSIYSDLEVEAQEMLNEVIGVFSNPKKEGMAINFALGRFFSGFNRLIGLQGMKLDPDTLKKWRAVVAFFNGPQLRDYMGGGIVYGIG
ncbi:hypothetical protein BZK37_12345 [Enterococcus casseliflavus]|nr:hypothetical protein BZK37_12345 [Enterococcus casseliflavus]